LVLRIIQAGTAEVCLVFFNRRIFLGDDLRAAIFFRHEELFLNHVLELAALNEGKKRVLLYRRIARYE